MPLETENSSVSHEKKQVLVVVRVCMHPLPPLKEAALLNLTLGKGNYCYVSTIMTELHVYFGLLFLCMEQAIAIKVLYPMISIVHTVFPEEQPISR
ncbi:hypothetical protein TNIN_79571 [Trichonephila inaurata madagascariensis]|uniref:Uncharacterized protein n=1 Tax=Trichonephila inaurata madagascariensis TaxID=2747483 RepID=A0A8X6WL01_9ARAC|nr:hypothetical protein TNIN_79571 [Trichonephila inaurata madagascariensis]